MLRSAILKGTIFHERVKPTRHQFSYPTAQWWLALDELEQTHQQSRLFSTKGFAPLWFKRSDYLRGSDGSLSDAVLEKASELAAEPLTGRVYFLGNLRTFGLYFSPINCYFIEQTEGEYRYMLAEVSNTPWNERHYYLVDLNGPLEHPKAFHVSPFNPVEMEYKWRLKPPLNQPNHSSLIYLEARRGEREFIASMRLKRVELNSNSILRVLLRYPVNTLTTLVAIHWHALRLWIKRTPIYDHPNKMKNGTSHD